ncbi:MAG: SusC/RagA family TonB-linked outer membrane protein [Prevotella sp.]|nr:SusC/RagA family TonB-linked outer membrane protein [Prevotella sp.]
MNNNKLLKTMIAAAGLLSATIGTRAQSSLVDYQNGQVDLGIGVVQSQKLSTVASQTISGEELQKTAALTLKDALYGRLLGLTALKNGKFEGESDFGARLNIRGTNSTSENKMLILVDGIERSIDHLTLNEIESVTVLRDGAATALYGYEGVNGAILVKTKRGSTEKLTVNANYNHKFTFDPQVAKFVDASTYATAMNKARLNDGLTPMYNQAELDAFGDGSAPYYYPNVDWQKEALRNVGSEDQLNLAIKGGNQRLHYFTLLDYTDSKGLLKNTNQDGFDSQLKFSKANIRANIDAVLTKTTTMQVHLLGSFIETNRPAGVNADGVFDMFYRVPSSAFPVKNNPEGDLVNIWGGNTTYETNNVVAQIQASGFQKSHARLFQGDLTLKQDLGALLKGLSASVRFGYNNYSQIYEGNTMGFMYGYQRYTFDADGNQNGLTTYSAGDKTDNLSFNYWLNQHSRSSYLSVAADYKTKFRDDDNFNATLIWNQKNIVSNGRYQTFNRMNWLLNLHYDLKEKYVADLVLGMNGSNRSYPEKWAFSPALSLGYIYANNDNGLLNYGKLRLSGAIQHLDYVPINGIWLENYGGGGGDYYFGAGRGSQDWGTFISFQPTRKFDLETYYKLNIGTDLQLAKSVDVTFNAYYQLCDDILMSADGLNSRVMGIPSGYVNYGRVANYGVELGVNWVKKVNDDLSFNIGGHLTWGRNNIRRTIENVAYNYLSAVGGHVNQAWGLQAIGFFKDEEDIANSPAQEFDTCKPGDFKYKDQNDDQVINENDVVKMGHDTSTPELNYAFNLGFKYKNFGFNALLQGAGMYTQYCGTTGVWTPLIEGANLSKEYYNNCWDVSDSPKYPRLSSQTNNNNYRPNNVWWQDVNFLKLRNIEVYYLLPKTLISRIYLSECKVFVKGDNLFTITNVKELDPENIGTSYPTLKGINVGVSLTF